MKGTCTLVASVLAASTVALYPSSSNEGSNCTVGNYGASNTCAASSSSSSSEKGKFAPRFDGLRFIETLVTAHR